MQPGAGPPAGASQPLARPAFYALRPGGWRDLVSLLHLPYTAWELANVTIGAAIAPHLHGVRLAATLAAFFLAVGIGAHVLDELRGRPMGTHLSSRALASLAVGSLAGAAAIGAVGAATVSLTLIPFILVGLFLAAAYNLEWFGGRFHTTFWLALSWGAFPVITSYWANALTIRPETLLAAGGCATLLVAQRSLSTPVRELRRRTVSLVGEQTLADGTVVPLDAARLSAPLERALQACALGMVLLAVGLLVARL